MEARATAAPTIFTRPDTSRRLARVRAAAWLLWTTGIVFCAVAFIFILATFSVICTAVFKKSILVVILPFSFGLLFALTGFEILVSFLQAFIFTILTAVYIGGSMHPEH